MRINAYWANSQTNSIVLRYQYRAFYTFTAKNGYVTGTRFDLFWCRIILIYFVDLWCAINCLTYLFLQRQLNVIFIEFSNCDIALIDKLNNILFWGFVLNNIQLILPYIIYLITSYKFKFNYKFIRACLMLFHLFINAIRLHMSIQRAVWNIELNISHSFIRLASDTSTCAWRIKNWIGKTYQCIFVFAFCVTLNLQICSFRLFLF